LYINYALEVLPSRRTPVEKWKASYADSIWRAHGTLGQLDSKREPAVRSSIPTILGWLLSFSPGSSALTFPDLCKAPHSRGLRCSAGEKATCRTRCGRSPEKKPTPRTRWCFFPALKATCRTGCGGLAGSSGVAITGSGV